MRALIGAVVLTLAGCAAAPAPAPEPVPLAPAPGSEVVAVHHYHHGPALHPGTQGMRALQRALTREGYYHGKITGHADAATRHAIARYQQNLGVQPANGVVDAQTWTALHLSEGEAR